MRTTSHVYQQDYQNFKIKLILRVLGNSRKNTDIWTAFISNFLGRELKIVWQKKNDKRAPPEIATIILSRRAIKYIAVCTNIHMCVFFYSERNFTTYKKVLSFFHSVDFSLECFV